MSRDVKNDKKMLEAYIANGHKKEKNVTMLEKINLESVHSLVI